MRAILLAFILTSAAPAAAAQTLLETVLYVVTLNEAKDDGFARITVAEDGPTLRSETSLRSGPRWTITITRMDDCAFDVDHAFDGFSARYTLDFADADLDAAALGPVKNRFGRTLSAVTIPNTKYCLAAGTPYLNAIVAGACADEFSVELAAKPRPGDLEKMLAAIRRLKGLCRPGVS